jgi:hypothetical protein
VRVHEQSKLDIDRSELKTVAVAMTPNMYNDTHLNFHELLDGPKSME